MSNERGTVAMARQMGRDTATSQFFINLKSNTTLDRGAPCNSAIRYSAA